VVFVQQDLAIQVFDLKILGLPLQQSVFEWSLMIMVLQIRMCASAAAEGQQCRGITHRNRLLFALEHMALGQQLLVSVFTPRLWCQSHAKSPDFYQRQITRLLSPEQRQITRLLSPDFYQRKLPLLLWLLQAAAPALATQAAAPALAANSTPAAAMHPFFESDVLLPFCFVCRIRAAGSHFLWHWQSNQWTGRAEARELAAVVIASRFLLQMARVIWILQFSRKKALTSFCRDIFSTSPSTFSISSVSDSISSNGLSLALLS
jgi:hypothetical protein